MNDDRIWEFERELWLGDGSVYRERMADDCVAALPAEPFLYSGKDASTAAQDTPRWEEVDFSETPVSRPEEGLIVIGYRAKARQGDTHYHALCTSTLRRLEHENWVVVQHQQTPFGVEVKDPDA